MKIIDCEQNKPEWMQARCGLPTASVAGRIITSTGAASKQAGALAAKLAGDLYAGHDIEAWEGDKYTERGHEIEGEAMDAYSLLFDCDVEEVGFCTDDTGVYGASPDGLIGSDGLVEIKCLPKEHIPSLLFWKRNGKPPAVRIPQLQMQLLVTQRDWVDLWYYQPGLPSLRIRVTPDIKLQGALRREIKALIDERNRILSILNEF